MFYSNDYTAIFMLVCVILTGLPRDLKLHETAGKYPSRNASHLPSRLDHSKEAVNEEENHRAHTLTDVIPINVKDIECEEDEVQVVHGEERVEVSGTNVWNGREPHDYCCHA